MPPATHPGAHRAYVADSRAHKVNLGVGVYYDDNGKLPLLKCIKKAEEIRIANAPARGYQPIEGAAAYNQAVAGLLFGSSSPLLADKRVITIETLGAPAPESRGRLPAPTAAFGKSRH